MEVQIQDATVETEELTKYKIYFTGDSEFITIGLDDFYESPKYY